MIPASPMAGVASQVVSRAELVLLLTATINPGATPMVARYAPDLRLKDYCEALTIWLQAGISKLVFVENSGADLSALRAIAAQAPEIQTEFISLGINEFSAQLGKGFGELSMIEAAFVQSALLQNAYHIAKCTGRLTLRNAVDLLDRIAGVDADLYCTFKRDMSFADSRFFIARPAIILDDLVPLKSLLNDSAGFFFENALARAAAGAISKGYRWRNFPVFPYVAGISGTFGTRMTDRPWTRLVKTVYHALRRYVYEH